MNTTTQGRPRSFDRDKALLAAMELFWAHGFEGASLSALTSAMGINAPSLYAAFGSKEKLFHEAVARYGQAEGVTLWQAVEAASTAKAAIAAFLEASAISHTQPGKPRGCLIVLSGLHSADTNPAVAQALIKHRAGNVEALRAVLQRDVATGALPATSDCQAIATFYATVQQGMSIQARDGADRATLLAIARAAMGAWDGLVGPEPIQASA